MEAKLQLLVLISLFGGAFSLTCYSSNGQSRAAENNGVEAECRAAFGAHERFCHKLFFDSRKDMVIRNCDFIYEQFMGHESVPQRKEGCWRFTATMNGVLETGIHCLCKGDRCNGGTVTEADLSAEDIVTEEDTNAAQA